MQEFKSRKLYDVLNPEYQPKHHEGCACEEGTEAVGSAEIKGLTLFTTATCPRCKAIKALFDKNGVNYTVVDCYENRSLVGAYGITGAPSLVVPLEDGSFEIYRNESEIRGFFDANLRK